MEDPPDLEPPGDAPAWAFYSLWPRMADGGAREESFGRWPVRAVRDASAPDTPPEESMH